MTTEALDNLKVKPFQKNSLELQNSPVNEVPSESTVTLNGKYRIIREIGHGAQGTIFHAIRLSDKLPVVIKQLNIQSIKSWKEYQLFEREAEILKSIDCPGVARFYDSFECLEDDPPCAYIVQEYIEGSSLQKLLKDGHRFQLSDVYDILLQTLDILNKLHHHDPPVIHRDIKPSNLMISPMDDGTFRVKIIDFGAVANPQIQGGGSTMAGTFGYMPPEQLMGHSEPASDIYALAAVGVYLFSGISPASMQTKDFRLVFEPDMQDKPYELVSLLRQMLDPDIHKRLVDYSIIKKTLNNLKNGHQFQKESGQNGLSDKLEAELLNVRSVCEAGTMELWQQYPDAVPRTFSENFEKKWLTIPFAKPDKKVSKNRNDIVLNDDGIDVINQNKLSRYRWLVTWMIVTILALAILWFVPSSKYILVFFLLFAPFTIYIIFKIANLNFWENVEENQEQSNTDMAETNQDQLGLNIGDIHQEQFELDNDKDYNRLKKKIYNSATKKYYFTIWHLLRFGRKSIAKIVDVEYLSVKDSAAHKIRNRVYGAKMYCSDKPAFRIRYAFNPPDDCREEDIMHECIVHSIPEDMGIGDTLPILYLVDGNAYEDYVMSMPFPVPFCDVICLGEILAITHGKNYFLIKELQSISAFSSVARSLRDSLEAYIYKQSIITESNVFSAIEWCINNNDGHRLMEFILLEPYLSVFHVKAFDALWKMAFRNDKGGLSADAYDVITNFLSKKAESEDPIDYDVAKLLIDDLCTASYSFREIYYPAACRELFMLLLKIRNRTPPGKLHKMLSIIVDIINESMYII